MNNIINRVWKQGSMVNIDDLRGMTFQAEDAGHTFKIRGIDGDGNPIALSGTPAGIMLRSDHQDVTMDCSVSDGIVSATLPANAYVVPGKFGITVYLTSDGQTMAIYAAIGSVSRTSSGTVAPPAGSNVVDLVNAIQDAIALIPSSDTNLKAAMAPTYSTSAAYAVGSYAWYNGQLYRCTTAITSGETWTSGHWTLADMGGDVADLKSTFESSIEKDDIYLTDNLFNGSLTQDKRWATSLVPVQMYDQTDYRAGEFAIPAGTQYITTNYTWLSGSYCCYTDDSYNLVGLIKNYSTGTNYVYSVPTGATKACFSFNAPANSTTYSKLTSDGVVVLAGNTAITTENITGHPYRNNDTLRTYYCADNLNLRSEGYKDLSTVIKNIQYKNINDEQINLANGSYSANGGTVSGNTVTVTESYQGIISNEFALENNQFRIAVKTTFNVQRTALKLQYYTNSWNTSDTLFDLTSGKEKTEVIDVSTYGASKFRILMQAVGITSGVTNIITVNSLDIYDTSDIQKSQYYDPEFNSMLGNIFSGLRGRVFTVKKDGSGDFDSLVNAVQFACQFMDSVVYIGEGEWDVIDEFGSDYMDGVASSANWGLELKNRVHLIGSARTVVKAINENTGGNTNFSNIKEYFSVFNAGQYGFTIENLTIIDDSIRYSVHDDLGTAGSIPYHNRYLNCHMTHTNGQYPDCIGAGIGEDGYIEIRGCYFDGDVTRNGSPVTRYVYWHGNNNSLVTNAKGRIFVTGCYFTNSGTFKLMNYGNSITKTIAYISGNSFGSEPEILDGSSPSPIIVNMEMVKWNNAVRN